MSLVYELWDMYGEPEMICSSNDLDVIRVYREKHIKQTNGECILKIKEVIKDES